jgi:hypothetical protein
MECEWSRACSHQEDLSQVAKIAAVADPPQAGNPWRNVEHAKDANYLNLQPGSSNFSS